MIEPKCWDCGWRLELKRWNRGKKTLWWCSFCCEEKPPVRLVKA